MKSTELKRTLLKVFIGFLIATAAMAIISVVMGDLGEFQMKVLVTTLTISAASICAMSGAAFVEGRGQKALGGVGMGLSFVAAALVIGGVWGGANDVDYWRTAMSFTILAVAFAHGFLLCLPRLVSAYHWVFIAVPVCIGVLAIQILSLMWEVADSEFFIRATTVNSILVVLLTLVVPILMRIGRTHRGSEKQRLVLTQQHENVFADPDGALYRVEPQSEWGEEDSSGQSKEKERAITP